MLYVRAVYFVAALVALSIRAEVTSRSFSVEVTALVQPSRAEIALSWPQDPDATGYTVSRKLLSSASWGPGISLPGQATGFTQSRIGVGSAFEYQIIKTNKQGFQAYGYIYAGMEVPLVEHHGAVILIVDDTYATDLKAELARLQQDLVGDGWIVRRHDVSRNESPAKVKARIKADYEADPATVKAVFLFGHVAVPYSGNIGPDGHPNHTGAWPADVYYGEMNGDWTDSTVESKQAERFINWNLKGDGKFDQSVPPSDVELQVGRVDLSNMTCFLNQNPSRSEKDLLRQYLNKDHAFRHRLINVERRGLICDALTIGTVDPLAGSGWRNLVPFFGSANVRTVGNFEYLPAVRTNSFLWSHTASGGSYYGSDVIGSSDDFALEDIQVVFTMFVGSYFGDWNNESNFLRAPLGSRTYVLTSAYSGQPHHFYHHMALGETVGFGTRLTQNNKPAGLYPPHNPGSGQVHIALMGDPTLRMHPVIPPSALAGAVTANAFILNWSPSADIDLQGYHVYRAASPAGPFIRITGNKPTPETTFTDNAPVEPATYMVRAIKLERSASGTYFNASQGIFYSTALAANWQARSVPTPPSGLMATTDGKAQIKLIWVDTTGDEDGFTIERKNGVGGDYAKLGRAVEDATGYIDKDVLPAAGYSYRVSAYNAGGESPYSSEISVISPGTATERTSVAFAASDAATKGNWKGAYGRDGYNIIGHSTDYPEYVQVTPRFHSLFNWSLSTSQERALQKRTDADRVAACWTAPYSFSIDLNFNDGKAHRVALYFLDWNGGIAGRVQQVEIIDPVTKAIRDTRMISDFHQGTYLIWYLSGHVEIRITRITQNTVLSGIFFDTDNAVIPPTFSPNGGIFAGQTSVALASVTAEATIRYTVDGSIPGATSRVYAEPFVISNRVTIRAKAYKIGMDDSLEASAIFEPAPVQTVFVGSDTNTQGNWAGVYGRDGYHVIENQVKYPSYVSVTPNGCSPFTWADDVSDARALQKEPGSSKRKAACWYSSTGFTLEFEIKDGRSHRVALYVLDWDSKARVQTIEVSDVVTGKTLDTRTIDDFSKGKYLIWDISGKVRFRLTKIAGDNAIVAGIFFDPAPGRTPLTLSTSELQQYDGLRVRAKGESGQRFVLEATSDLIHWTPLVTNTLASVVGDFLDTNANRFKTRFYRARLEN
jgi:hypothetical protein